MGKNTGHKKINKFLQVLENGGAKVIFKYDAFAIKADAFLGRKLKQFLAFLLLVEGKVENSAAKIVEKYDIITLKTDRILLIVRYNIARKIYNIRQNRKVNKKTILSHFAGALLIALAVVALFSYTTGYSYSYNGRQLGFIKDQEEVLKILDLVSNELSKEYGTSIKIDRDKDIKFERAYIMDKDVDDVNDVLKRFTYMSDMQTKGFEILIDGKSYAICESEKVANEVLDDLKKDFMEKSDRVKYKSVKFKENVEIREIETKLAKITSKEKAIDTIMDGGMAEKIYVVQNGDTYYDICNKFNISFENLREMNPGIKEEELYPGDEIKINRAVSALTVITVEERQFAEVLERKVKVEKSDSMYEGEEEVLQKGSDGKKLVTAVLTKENGEIIKRKDIKTEILQDSVERIVVKGTKPIPKTMPTGSFINPVPSAILTSPYGWRWGRLHEGIDLATSIGTPIMAADGGTVVRSGWYGGYGLCVDIDHGGGTITRYGHCSETYVSVGEEVYQGQTIAALGNTGYSTGPHVHFEIRVNGSSVNPLDYI